MAEARTHLRRMRGLLGRSTAGHGVLRSKSIHRKDAKTQRSRTAGSASSIAPSRLCGESSAANRTVPAGHGVLRSNSTASSPATPAPATSARAARLLSGTAPLAPFSAGHGVHRSVSPAGLSRPGLMV
jgi:hypothetical protein